MASPRLSGKVRTEELEYKLGMCQKFLGRTRAADRHFTRALATGAGGEYAAKAGEMRSKAAAKSSRASGRGTWCVQAGVFSRKPGALDLQKRLRAAGFKAAIRSEQKAGTVYYSVRIGRFSSEESAKAEAGRLGAAGFQCVIKR